MRRHTTSRILLSALLLWQLVAGVFAHAHGSAQPSMAHEAMNVQTLSGADMDQEHCADHGDMSMADMDTMDMEMMDMDAGMDMPMDHGDDSQPKSHHEQPDCCQTLLCKCPCLQALALSVALPHVAAAAPDSLHLVTIDAPLLSAGVSGQFRPPI